MSDKKEKFRLLHKPPKGKMMGLLIVFSWIMLWNIIYQAVHHMAFWEKSPVQIINWAFFISVTLFFIQEELSFTDKFWHTLVGGTVGILAASVVVNGTAWLAPVIGSKTVAICIFLALMIGALIMLHPFLPTVFNDVGFCYFIVAFTNTKGLSFTSPDSVILSLIFSLVLGSLVLNLPCIFLIKKYRKYMARKMAAAKQK